MTGQRMLESTLTWAHNMRARGLGKDEWAQYYAKVLIKFLQACEQ
jgi:hypothetical protein